MEHLCQGSICSDLPPRGQPSGKGLHCRPGVMVTPGGSWFSASSCVSKAGAPGSNLPSPPAVSEFSLNTLWGGEAPACVCGLLSAGTGYPPCPGNAAWEGLQWGLASLGRARRPSCSPRAYSRGRQQGPDRREANFSSLPAFPPVSQSCYPLPSGLAGRKKSILSIWSSFLRKVSLANQR